VNVGTHSKDAYELAFFVTSYNETAARYATQKQQIINGEKTQEFSPEL
jgi:hypothetical protein